MSKIQRIVFVAAFGVPVAVSFAADDSSKDYIVNKHVGKTERMIVERFGKPTSVTTIDAKELGGELRRPVREKHFGRRPKAKVRELYYKLKKGELIFWLDERPEEWVVVSDIWIAPGVVF